MRKEDDFEEKLAAFDFSGDSRVRASVRARLLARGARRTAAAPLALALAAATAAVLLLPLGARRQASTAFPVGANGLPVLPGSLPVRAASPEPVFETRPVTIDEIFVRRTLRDAL